jgi:hypothetical protein
LNKSRKGGLEFSQFIEVMLGVIFLLSMVYFTYDYLSDSYDSEVAECNFFMENVDGKPKYFGEGLKEITLLFQNSVSSVCPSKEVILKENSFKNSAKLVRSCYEIIGAGEDFFGANSDDQSVCVHCGFIKVDEEISDFNKKFSKILSEDSFVSLFDEDDEMSNTNKMFLSETVLSSSLSEGDYLRVLGYAYKPSVYTEDSTFLSDTTNFFSLTVSEFFSEYVSSSAGFLLSDSSVKGFSGVIVEPFEGYEEFDTSRKIGFSNSGSSLGCDVVIIPNKNYD